MNYNYFVRNDSTNLFNPEQGYNLGNMFADLYDPYKNYKPVSLKASNQKERDYLELSRISFAMHEMNLFLDIHPDDSIIQNLFNDYRRKFVELEKNYEDKYGALSVCSDSLEKEPFGWATTNFPWEDDINV